MPRNAIPSKIPMFNVLVGVAAIAIWLSLLASCSGTAGAGDAANAPIDDTQSTDVTLDSGKITKDVASDGPAPDTAAAEGVVDDDVATADVGAKCPGAPGCSCKENGDCDNAQCIEIGSGKVCATPCVDKCQDGYKCTLINSGSGDSVTICVPKFIHLCDPCVKSKDCQTLGSSDAACVAEGGQGNFCGTACAADGDCAAGYGCQSVNSVEGAPVKQCVKTSTAPELKFGECTCSELAVAQKSQTNCFIEHKNDKGELVGKCAGVRACGASGLTTCAAPALDVEVCDGKDNDCDGLTDESTCDAGGACNVGTCDPQTGCQYNKLNNVPCDADKNACTDNDQCKQGVCVPGPGKVCDDGNPCTTDSCDPASGCTKTVDDGKLCDADGDACTAADHCVGPVCSPGKPVVCDNTNVCSKSTCNSLSGKCVGKAVQDGVSCDDGTLCTQTDICKGGDCIGKIVSCDDNNPCTGNSCDPVAGCSTVNLDGIACDDDNPCTVGDLCKVGNCVKGAAKACESGASCVAGSCDLTNGKCGYKNKVVGAPCDDGDACSQADGCSDGVCQGKSLNCDDSNACTNDSCDKLTGCVHNANVSPCSDGDACTQSDNCVNSVCVSGQLKVCEDNVLCTADTCNKTTGNCVFDALGMNGTPCDDGNICTLGDNCKGGACTVGIPKDCNDNNVCTDDLCDKVKGCNPNFNSKACDDGNACTQSDICKFGDCEGSAVNCNDSNVCTNDACDSKKGCVNTGNSGQCNDNNACTMNDSCKNSACGGPAVDCDDGTVCTDDTCDKLQGCVHSPNVALCPDSDACTTGETCKNGNCVKKAVVCDDGNECTLDTCDGVKGCQVANVVDKTPCNAGAKWCIVGKCSPLFYCGDGMVNQVSEECDDGNLVDNDGCSNACKANVPASFTLSPCGATGPKGPTQAQCDAAYAAQNFKVTVVGGIQELTLAGGVYHIEAFGAKGGGNGGAGAKAVGDITVQAGAKIRFLVGQMGGDAPPANPVGNGGGGGSFVTTAANAPLIIGGGGGGTGHNNSFPNYVDIFGKATNNGGTGQYFPGSGSAGGANGNGALVGLTTAGVPNGGGGAGLLTDGGSQGAANGGKAFVNGGVGGDSTGGFGGGGGSNLFVYGCGSSPHGGSGGGGYSGGGVGGTNCNGSGGGGGSYVSGANAVMTAGSNGAQGKITVQKL